MVALRSKIGRLTGNPSFAESVKFEIHMYMLVLPKHVQMYRYILVSYFLKTSTCITVNNNRYRRYTTDVQGRYTLPRPSYMDQAMFLQPYCNFKKCCAG